MHDTERNRAWTATASVATGQPDPGGKEPPAPAARATPQRKAWHILGWTALAVFVSYGLWAATMGVLTVLDEARERDPVAVSAGADDVVFPSAVRQVCQPADRARGELRSLRSRVPDTSDFDVISMWLLDVYDVTAFLSGWADIPDDARYGTVRDAARAALAHTGQYGDGTNPITGSELVSNLRSADRYWADLDKACSGVG